MRLELQHRANPSRVFAFLSPVLALVLTLVAGAIMFSLLGKPAGRTIYTFFVQPLLDPWLREQIIAKATPLILIAVGLAVCFRSSNWNIGAEGQYLIGGLVGSIIPVFFNDWQSPVVLPLVICMGMLGGAFYAFIPAILKSRFGTNEILTSLMLVYVAQQFVDWVVRGPWRNPQGQGFPGTVSFNESATLPNLFPGGDAHWGFIFALIATVLVWLMLSKTMKGFEVKVVGQAPRAGAFAGFDAGKTTVYAFLISGALAGLAGISEVAGTVGKLDDKLSLGYGFTAIIVVFLGRLNPLGVLLGGFILALSFIGGEEAQITLQLSDRAVRVFQGLLLFFVLACDTLVNYRLQFAGSAPPASTSGGNP